MRVRDILGSTSPYLNTYSLFNKKLHEGLTNFQSFKTNEYIIIILYMIPLDKPRQNLRHNGIELKRATLTSQ